MFTHPTSRLQRRRTFGFTLIELLVVIAIIAILTAIIFPVFATLRENARQKTAMSNLHDIQNGLFQFRLDNGRYPEVLFGYALPAAQFPGARMDNALALAQQQNAAAQYFPGLYPEYIKDPLTFTDPNNVVKDLSRAATEYVNTLTPNVTPGVYDLTPTQTSPATDATTSFYLADAYDISPEIAGPNQLTGGNGSPSTYVVRYQKSWTGVGSTRPPAGPMNEDYADQYPLNYTRQMRWTNPPADTYITCTTHHVPNSDKVIVLWESGAAKAINSTQFLMLNGASGADSPSVTGAAFWQVSPTNNSNPGP